ncbi:MAG: DUF169 domain-containing protein [Candidatus Hydrothermarchaeaceae archaeon]
MENVREYLGMKYNLVGVKILKDEVSKDKLDELGPDDRMQYCQFVREVASGKSYIFKPDDFTCPNPIVTLGFEEPTYVDVQPRITPAETKAVWVAPLNMMEEPDVILAILNPKQVMEVAILLEGIEAKSAGSMAVCGEATARPFMEGKPNITFLCPGARTYGDYRDHELIVGIPLEALKKISKKVEALSKTCGALCGCLTSDISPSIIQSFEKIGFEKGTDYFFGKVDKKSVRVYLNKDSSGRIDFITIHLPIKGEVKTKDPSLTISKRGKWTDVSLTTSTDGNIELDTGKGVEEAIREVISKVSN